MKTNNRTQNVRAGAVLLRTLRPVGMLAGLILPMTVAAADAEATASKEYTMFVGDHLAVHDKNGPNPVIGVANDSLIVRRQDSTRKIPLNNVQGLRFERAVKLSNSSAEVGEVKVALTNEAANQAWFEASSVQIALHGHAAGVRDRASGDVRRLSTLTSTPNDPAFGESAMAEAEAKMMTGMTEGGTVAGVADLYGQTKTSGKSFADADTVKITFELSSPQPLGKGYVALITEFKSGVEEGGVQRGISVKDFDRLDSKPRKFTLRQRLPAESGPLQGYRIAVYADGQEVATNLSERRSSVTKDEAHQFFLLQYILANKGQTRGPSLIPLLPKPQLKAAAQGVDLPPEVFVKVDKKGSVISLSTDKSGDKPVTPQARAFLDNVRFLPALSDGMPIEGSARVAMADVLR